VHRHLPELASVTQHIHASSQALLYLSGDGWQRISRNTARVEPGTLVMIPPASSFTPSPARGARCRSASRSTTGTFALVSSLFLLWGFCNGMIDVMDKHFQEELHLSLAQSAWVQFAHYLGYFLMALPAGWLATRLGYKGGIIAGLLMVALGGFWFIPATHIARPVLGFFARRLRDRHRPHLPRNRRQPLHHRARRPAIRRHAHQPRAILQRRRLDLRPDRRAACSSIQRTPPATAPAARRSGSPTPRRGRRLVLAVIFLFRRVCPTSRRRTTTTSTTPPPASRTPSGRIPTSSWPCRAVLLRRRAGRHLQLLHQLHDLAGPRHPGAWNFRLTTWPTPAKSWFEVNKRASSPSATKARPTSPRSASFASWPAGSAARP
jgi:hypothetical protein